MNPELDGNDTPVINEEVPTAGEMPSLTEQPPVDGGPIAQINYVDDGGQDDLLVNDPERDMLLEGETIPTKSEVVDEQTVAEADGVFALSADAVGSKAKDGSWRNREDIKLLFTDLQSDNYDVARAALQNLASNPNVPLEYRIKATESLGTLINTRWSTENLPLVAISRAEENLAESSGDYDSRIGIIEKKSTPAGLAAFHAMNAAQSPDDVSELLALEAKGDVKGMAAYVYKRADDQMKFFSMDFGIVAVTPSESTWTFELIKLLNNPTLNKYLEDVGPVGTQLGFGEFRQGLGKIFNDLPKDEQIRVLKTAYQLGKKRAVTLEEGGNSYIYWSIMEALTEQVLNEGQPVEGFARTAQRYLENAGGVLDAYGIFALAKLPLTLGTRLLKRTAISSSRIAPTATATRMAQELMNGEDAVRRVYGVDYSGAMDLALAKHTDNLRAANMSQELAGKVALNALGQDENFRQLQQAIFGTKPADLSAQQLTDGMRAYLGRKNLVGQSSMSEIASDGDIISVNGRFGSKDGVGFANRAEAERIAASNLGKDGFDLSIRHKESGVFVTKEDEKWKTFEGLANNPKTADSYEWFVDAKYKTSFDNVYNLSDFVDSSIVGQKTGKVANLMFDIPLTRSISYIWDNVTNAALKWHAGNEKHVQDLFNNLYRPEMDKLSSSERSVVMRAIYENAGKDKLLDEADLVALGVKSTEAKEAYYSYTRGMAIAHSIADRGLARSYASDGFVKLYGSDGNMLNLAKEADLGDVPIRNTMSIRVIDNNGVQVKSMSPSELDAAVKAGSKIYRHKMAEWVGSDEVAFSLVSKNKLADNVGNIGNGGILPYAAGYFPEIMRGQLSVYGETANGNKWLLATAETTKDAERIILEFQNTKEMTDKYINFGQEYFSGYRDAVQSSKRAHEIYENLQGVVYGHKSGNEVINASGINAISNKLDPLEAADSMFAVLANNYTKGSHIQYRNRQVHEFALRYGLVKKDVLKSGRTVQTVDDLVDAGNLAGEKLRALRSAQRWIKTTEAFEMNPDFVARGVSWLMKKVASASAARLPFLEKYALDKAQKWGNPLSVFSMINYFTSIVASPHRQFLMNSAQALSNLAHPIAFTKAVFRDHHSFQQAFFYYQDASVRGVFSQGEMDKILGAYAKDMGISLKQMRGLLKAYLEGGLFNQVSHSGKLRDGMKTELELRAIKATGSKGILPNLVTDVTEKVGAGFGMVGKAAENIGFALGEHQNTISTFLTLFEANKKNPAFDVTTDAGRKMLAGKTMEWIGNMTPEGRIGFQKGLGTSWFQFSAFSYKQALNISPVIMGGSKMLTPAEKFTIAASQALMFGADATYFGKIIRAGFEEYVLKSETLFESEEQRQKFIEEYNAMNAGDIIEQGTIGAYGNNLMTAIGNAFFDEEGEYGSKADNLNLGQQYGLGAVPELFYERLVLVGDLVSQWRNIDSVSDAVKFALQTLGGTGGKKFVSMYDWAINSGKLIGTDALNEDLLTPDERTRLYKGAVASFARLSSGLMNDAMVLRAEEHYQTKGFRDVVAASTFKQRISSAFRITSESDEAYFEARRLNKKISNYQDQLGAPTKKREEALDDQANIFWNYILRQAESIPMEGESNYGEAVARDTESTIKLLLVMLPKEDRIEIINRLRTRLADAQAGGGSEAELTRRLIGEVQNAPNGKGNIGWVLDLVFSKMGKTNPLMQSVGRDWLQEEERIKMLEGTQED